MVYGYVRVSTVRQADEGESLEVQQRTLTGYALMHGLEISHMYVERGVSGSIPLTEREQGAALCAALRSGDSVITPKLDRMFRSALDALDTLSRFKEREIGLHMIDLGGDVTGNGISKLVFTILSAVAEAERDRIRERITQVKRDQRDRSRYLGGYIPFGQHVSADGALIADEAKMAVLADACSMRQRGLTLRVIQDMMRDKGYPIAIATIAKLTRPPHT